MARKAEKILRKETKSGITVTLLDNTVIKKYSKTYVCMAIFSTRKEALKEFNLFRQGHKKV